MPLHFLQAESIVFENSQRVNFLSMHVICNLSLTFYLKIELTFGLNEKNPKRGTITERVLRKKSRAQHREDLYMFLCFGFFFQKTRSATVPKNGIVVLH